MPLYVFVCACGRSSESLQKVGTEAVACACGEQAQRRAIYATQIGGRQRTPINERSINLRQFDEATQQLEYEHQRLEESAQRSLPTPPIAEIAMATAKKLERAGIKDSLDYRPEYVR